jgi:very-short-patch-repair endonuclease
MERSFVDNTVLESTSWTFTVPECRLAVELDGEAHFTSIRAEYDIERQAFVTSLNISTVRFENRLAFENLESVLETIKQHLK